MCWARCTARLRCVRSSTGSLSCRGTQHDCLQPLPAKALVPYMLPQGLIGTGAPSVIPEHYAPIRVVLSNPSQSRQSKSIRLPHRQSDSVHYYILLHIIKIIFIFDSFTCTGRPDLIDQGRFKFAGRNLVGLPILMPLIDTN